MPAREVKGHLDLPKRNLVYSRRTVEHGQFPFCTQTGRT